MRYLTFLFLALLLMAPSFAMATGTGLDTTGGPQYFGIGGNQVGVWTTDRFTSANGIQPGFTNACDPTAAGTMRWNPAGYMEVCNGGGWVKLGGKPVFQGSFDAQSTSGGVAGYNTVGAYDLCDLSKTFVEDNSQKINAQCLVSPVSGGWQLQALIPAGGHGFVYCSMSCYNFQ